MDNLTHSLVGLAVGQAVAQCRPGTDEQTARLRLPLWVASAVANNLPDLDFIYARTTPGPLGYLLHHRGHTHTLLLALPQALVVLAGMALYARLRGKRWNASEWRWLAFVCAIGPVLHIALDFGNSYGIHPFWPFDNTWKYGDSIFILEPWLWLCLAPTLLFGAATRAGKGFFGLVIAGALGACVFSGFVPWQMSLLLIAFTAWLLGLMTKLKPRGQALAGLAAYASVCLLFTGVSQRARSLLTAELTTQFPDTTLAQLALSPLPADPFCWQFFAVGTEADSYTVRRGLVAPFPHMISAAHCPEFRSKTTDAPLADLKDEASHRPYLLWQGQFTGRLSELKALYANDCRAQATLRFARVPVWYERGGQRPIADLRFDRGGRSFARTDLNASEPCPTHVPPWTPPLSSLLR